MSRRHFIFEGSLVEKIRFWASTLHFWRKSRRNASFWSFKGSFLKDVSQKSFVFWASKLQFWRKSRTKADNQNHLNLNSFESDMNWLSNQLNSARSLPIGSLSLETSATALCGRYVSYRSLFAGVTILEFSWVPLWDFQGLEQRSRNVKWMELRNDFWGQRFFTVWHVAQRSWNSEMGQTVLNLCCKDALAKLL